MTSIYGDETNNNQEDSMDEEHKEHKEYGGKVDDKAVSEERASILRMLHDGKLTVDEAEMLLDALERIEYAEGFRREGGGSGPGNSTRTSADGSENNNESESATPGERLGEGIRESIRRVFKGEDIGRSFSEFGDEIKKTVKSAVDEAQRQFDSREFLDGLDEFEGVRDLKTFGEKLESLLGRARLKVERSVALPADGVNVVEAKTLRGDISARAESEDGRIHITARITARGVSEERLREIQDQIRLLSSVGDGVMQLYIQTDGEAQGIDYSVEYDLVLPDGIAVDFDTKSGDISVEGPLSSARCSTASGDICISDVDGDTRAESKSGDITLEGVSGAIRGESKSGDLELAELHGTVFAASLSGDIQISDGEGVFDLSTKSGDVEFQAGSIETMSAQAVSGDVTVDARVAYEFAVRLSTVSGDIECTLPNDTSFELEARSVSGDMECGFPLVESEKSRRLLRGRTAVGDSVEGVESVDGGSVESAGKILLTSTSGSINLTPA